MIVVRITFLALVALLVSSSMGSAQAQPNDEKSAVEKKVAEPDAKKPAEDSKPADEEPKTPIERFEAANREWNALDKRLTELQRTYDRTPSPAAQAEIKAQYQELVNQSNLLLPKLRAAAEAAYLAEPNKNTELTRLLIGMVAYEHRRDNFESAVELARLLEEHKCDEPVLYAVAGAAAYQMDDYATAEKYFAIAEKAGKLDPNGKDLLAELPAQKAAWEAEQEIRKKEAEADDLPRVALETSKGRIVIELFENEAPQTVGNFIHLVEKGFYNGLTFHRVLGGFMAQGGDPTGDGTGGPGYTIFCECHKENYRRHFRGTLSMAHAGRDTGGSQFFLTFRPTTHLNGRHTAFGRVIEGMDVLAKLQRRDPTRPGQPAPDKIVKAEVLRKRDHKYEPTKSGNK